MSVSPSQSFESDKKLSVGVSEHEDSTKGNLSEARKNQKTTDPDDELSIQSMTPLPDRSISQISQVSARPSLTSRKSSPGLGGTPGQRQSSIKSAISHIGSGAESGVSFFSHASSKKKGKGLIVTQDSREITFTVSLAMAVPACNDDDEKRAKRIVTDPKAQSFYHVEYFLLPVDVDPVKTDVTLFGIAAKLYPERQEARLLKTWTENNKTWIAWTHSHKVNVTTDLLKKLCYHRIVARVWDTRERFSVTAKNDRPKAFKLPHPKPGEDIDDLSGVKTIVSKHGKAYIRELPKNTPPNRPLPAVADIEAAMAAKNAGSNGGSGGKSLAQKEESSRGAESMLVKKPNPSKRPKKTKQKSVISAAQGDEIPSLLVAHPDMEYKNVSRLMELALMESPINNKPARPTLHAPDQRVGSTSPELQKAPPPTAPSLNSQGADHSTDIIDKDRESSLSKGEEFVLASSSKQRTPVPHAFPAETPGGQTLKSKSPGGGGGGARGKPRDKKAEMVAKDNVEYSKKFGVCSIHLPLGALFMGSKSASARLEVPVKSMHDGFISVSVDLPLLTEAQKVELNPISVQLQSVKNLPDTPISFQELKLRCQPVTARFQFLQHPEYQLKPKDHSKDIYWNEKAVMLLGTIPAPEVNEYLLGPPMAIEVHDRDLKASETEKILPSLFGKEAEDEKISNVGVVSGKRTTYNPLREQPQQWNPYGVASADLSDLLVGERVLNLRLPLKVSAQPDVLGREKDDRGRLVGNPSAVDGPTGSHLRAGDYVESGSFLKVRIELAAALATPEGVKAKPTLPQTKECPFNRIVYRFEYSQLDVAKDLINLVMDMNANALGLSNLVPMVLDAALSTYRLTAEQKASGTLDIVTGFQVMDGNYHVFVLEGLKDGSMKRIWYTLPKPRLPEIQVLYNSDLAFGERLYGNLDVDLTRVKLHEPLTDIVQQPLLYVRDVVPKASFEALNRLNELVNCRSMRHAAKTTLFPSANMVISMSREFGIPLVPGDLITETEKQYIEEARGATEPTDNRVSDALYSGDMGNSHLAVPRSREKRKEALDNYNHMYMEQLESRERDGEESVIRDHVSENIRSVDVQSSQVRARREESRCMTQAKSIQRVHNYSTQTYNSTQLAIENIREGLKKDRLYTYNPEFQHSHTFVPVNVKKLREDEAEVNRKQWKTDKGWTYPGVRNLRQCNENHKQPDEARIQALKEEWIENSLHANKREPTLNKETYSWIDRKFDMDTWTQVPETIPPVPPHSITWTDEITRKSLARAATEEWQSKVRVEETRMRLHRLNPRTEMMSRGPNASNDQSRLESLLKDTPKKFSYSAPGFRLSIPPLNVVHNTSVDRAARAAGTLIEESEYDEGDPKAFNPGPLERSWTMEHNQIPTYDYQHAEEGYFNVYHKPYRQLYKRPIQPLKEREFDTHLFKVGPLLSTRLLPAHSSAISSKLENERLKITA